MKMRRLLVMAISGLLIVSVLIIGASCGSPAPAPAPAPAPSPSAAPAPAPSASPAPKPTSTQAPAPAPTVSLQNKIKITIATANPESDVKTISARKIKTWLEEWSKGQIEVAVFPAGQILTDAAMVEGIPSGIADIGLCTLAQWSGVVPEILAISLGGVFPSPESYWAARDGGLDAYVAKKFEEKAKVKVLDWQHSGQTDCFANTKKELKVPSDFAGIKIRAPSKSIADALKAVGAAAVVIPTAEVYTSLQTGVVDGCVSNVNAWDYGKYAEITKFVTRLPLIYSAAHGIVVSLNTWNKWPKDVQDMVKRATADIKTFSYKYANDQENVLWDKAKANPKLKVYEVPTSDLGEFTKLIGPGQLAGMKNDVGEKSYTEMMEIINKFIKK